MQGHTVMLKPVRDSRGNGDRLIWISAFGDSALPAKQLALAQFAPCAGLSSTPRCE